MRDGERLGGGSGGGEQEGGPPRAARSELRYWQTLFPSVVGTVVTSPVLGGEDGQGEGREEADTGSGYS